MKEKLINDYKDACTQLVLLQHQQNQKQTELKNINTQIEQIEFSIYGISKALDYLDKEDHENETGK